MGFEKAIQTTSKLSLLTSKRAYIFYILLIIATLNAIILSINEKNPYPLIREIGGRLIATDETIYYSTKNIVENPQKIYLIEQNLQGKNSLETFLMQSWSLIKRVWYFLMILSSFYFLYMIIYVLWWFSDYVFIHNMDNFFGNLFLALIFMGLIQMIFAFITYNPYEKGVDYYKLDWKDKLLVIAPFKGIIYFSIHFIDYIELLYENLVIPVWDKPGDVLLNQSLQQQIINIAT